MTCKGAILLTAFFIGNIILPSQAQRKHESEEVRLTRRLLQDYITSARPVIKDSDVTNVTLDVAFNQLVEIDKGEQVMTASIWLRMNWVDEYLTWNATEHGIDSIILSPDDIWRPDMTLINNAHDEVNSIPVDKNVRVNSSGYVTWLQSSISKSQCTLFSLYFPFDIQTCKLVYGSWAYDSDQINLFAKNEQGDISEFVPNGVWQLNKIPVRKQYPIYICCPKPFVTLTYYVVLQRLSLYFVINLYVPCVLLSFISLMVFYLPSSAGERTSFAVTMLLSLTVFMLVATEYLPDSSSSIPIISQYLTGTIVLLGLVVFTTILTLQIHHRGDYRRDPPKWLKSLVLKFLARTICFSGFAAPRRKKTKYSLAPKPDDQDAEGKRPVSKLKYTPNSGSCFSRSSTDMNLGRTNVAASISEDIIGDNLSQLNGLTAAENDTPTPATECKVLSEIEKRHVEEDKHDSIREVWHLIAAVLDRFFLIVFFLTAVALSVFSFLLYFTGERGERITSAETNDQVYAGDHN